MVNHGKNFWHRQTNMVGKLLSPKVIVVEFIYTFHGNHGSAWSPFLNNLDRHTFLFFRIGGKVWEQLHQW